VMAIIDAGGLLAMRHAHALGDIDKQWPAIVDQLKNNTAEQGHADLLPMVDVLYKPEFHAGMMLAGMGIATVLLLVLTTTGGAFAGFLRGRARTAGTAQ
jgi:hypothetical protein